MSHAWRAKDGITHKMLINKPNRKIPHDKPRQRWLDRVNNDLENLDRMMRIEGLDDRERWMELDRNFKLDIYFIKIDKISR